MRGTEPRYSPLTRLAPWASLFRLPNLSTAAGDAVAGGSLAIALSGDVPHPGALRAVFAAAAAEFFLYLAGLVDNDLCDLAADRASGKRRPIATGAIPRSHAEIARFVCFLAAALCVEAVALHRGRASCPWIAATAATALSIFFYNRIKERIPSIGRLLMGACRGFALISGFAAAASTLPLEASNFYNRSSLIPLATAAIGWTLYIAAVTRLGEREEVAGAPLARSRYIPAAFAILPFLSHFQIALFSGRIPETLTTACAFAAAATWVRAVAPLGKPHSPRDRGRAVGRTIGGLLFMQTALCLCGAPGASTVPAFAIFAAACWLARFAARAAAPSISGS